MLEAAPFGDRLVLRDPRLQGGHVLVLDPGKPIVGEPARGLPGRAGACESEHRAVLQPQILRTLGQAALGPIECRQQLPAALGVEYVLMPAERHESILSQRRSLVRAVPRSV